jgi:hypothetical protein
MPQSRSILLHQSLAQLLLLLALAGGGGKQGGSHGESAQFPVQKWPDGQEQTN